MIDKPVYYQRAVDVCDLVEAYDIAEGFYAGNIIKYVVRYGYKDGLQDLYKAQTYLAKLISLLEGVEEK